MNKPTTVFFRKSNKSMIYYKLKHLFKKPKNIYGVLINNDQDNKIKNILIEKLEKQQKTYIQQFDDLITSRLTNQDDIILNKLKNEEDKEIYKSRVKNLIINAIKYYHDKKTIIFISNNLNDLNFIRRNNIVIINNEDTKNSLNRFLKTPYQLIETNDKIFDDSVNKIIGYIYKKK